jgi:hypothetical protein
MRIRLSTLLFAILPVISLGAVPYDTGNVLLKNHSTAPGYALTLDDLWVYFGGDYTLMTGATALIYQPSPIAGAARFLIPAPNVLVYEKGRTVSVWDGSTHFYGEAETGTRDILTADSDITEIAPARFGHFLVAEQWNTPDVGAKLVEFDFGGVVAEYRLPTIFNAAHDRVLGANHIEVLSDGCTVLYTLGLDDSNPGRVHRFNLCTGAAEADFSIPTSSLEYAGSVRQLPNGNVLVATGKSVRELTPEGVPAYEWAFENVTHLALTPDGHAFYAAGVNQQKEDFRFYNLFSRGAPPKTIQIGNPEMKSLFVPDRVLELEVVSEWRAAVVPMRTRAVRHR